ncbi:hypothetical protein Tco_0194926 [Tanacetum coccineum]
MEGCLLTHQEGATYVLLGHKLISVYVEHEQTSFDTYNLTPIKKCTIGELQDDAPVPSEFADAFYSAFDNQNFDPFLSLDDVEVVEKLMLTHQARSVKGLHSIGICMTVEMKTWFDRFSVKYGGGALSDVATAIGAAQDQQKSYADLKRKPMEFEVGDRVMLKKCYADEPLVMPLEGIHVDDKLQFVEEPIEIIEREIKLLKRSRIPLVKVLWNSRRGPEFTWEREDSFKQKYPQLFTNWTSSSTTRS